MPASTEAWSDVWFWWLLFVAVSWLVLEIASILVARSRGQRGDVWTLSDTIRRWSVPRRWLAPVAVGIIAMLIWHWFAQLNPS